MKISASIYSNKEKDLNTLVRELDAHHIDMFHVDCADNDKVFGDIADIRKASSTPIDLHIISSEPEKYFDRIEKLKIEYVSFQYENLEKSPILPSNTTAKFGLSVVSSTSLDVLENLKENGYSFVIIMCTTPGVSGGTFNGDSFQKIIEFKHRFPKIQIHVDGGINDQVAFILRLLGVNAIVSGSYLLNHESLGAGMLSFHKTPNNKPGSYQISDFAVPVKYLPVLIKEYADFKTVLQTIEKYGLGFVAITDETGKLEGIVSNADVRKALLANLNGSPNPERGDRSPLSGLGDLPLSSLINTKPITIDEKGSLTDMIRLLNELNFIVLFLPVIDAKNHLKGAILLNNLTRV